MEYGARLYSYVVFKRSLSNNKKILHSCRYNVNNINDNNDNDDDNNNDYNNNHNNNNHNNHNSTMVWSSATEFHHSQHRCRYNKSKYVHRFNILIIFPTAYVSK